MEHLMIDLETLGTKSNSVFLSLVAIPFNIDTGFTGPPFTKNISLDSSLKAGLTVDESTIRWWMQQRPEILALMFEHPAHLHNVLVSFSDFVRDNKIVYLWGNSARFDIGLLENAFDKTAIEIPWKYYNEMCYRTVKNLFPSYSSVLKSPERAHDPLYDCEYQIKVLCKIWSKIKPL